MFASKRALSALCGTAILAAALAVASCTLPDPKKAPVAVQPTNAPVRNLTSFSEALRCMDGLFQRQGKNGFIITSKSIPDATGKLALGSRDMLITSISRMSQVSQAFRYVDYETDQLKADSVQNLSQMFYNANRITIDMPQVYISGSISQVEQGVQAGREGVGLTTGVLDIGGQRDRNVSLVTLELHLGDFRTRTIIPGADSTNTIAVVRTGEGMDAGAKIHKAGVSFNFGSDISEGSGQAVRTLIELGTIELLGRWTRVPYWECLQIERTNPAVLTQLRDWFDGMSQQQLIEFHQAGLSGLGYYKGPVNGTYSDVLRTAITNFQTDRGLVPNGQVSFEVYEALMEGKVKMHALPSAPPKPVTISGPQPINVNLQAQDGLTYDRGQRVQLNMSLSRGGFPYCYYRDVDGTVVQIYPNRFQPDKLIAGNRPVLIPDPSMSNSFSLQFIKSGREEVVCVATEVDIGTLMPAALRAPELTPLPFHSLDEVVNAVKAVVQPAPMGASRLTFTVH